MNKFVKGSMKESVRVSAQDSVGHPRHLTKDFTEGVYKGPPTHPLMVGYGVARDAMGNALGDNGIAPGVAILSHCLASKIINSA